MPVSKNLLHALLVACPTPPGDSSDPPSACRPTSRAGWLTALLCATGLTLGGCSPAPDSGKAGPTFRTQALPFVFGLSDLFEVPIYWLDNDRVFLPGYLADPDGPNRSKDGKSAFTALGLYIHDTRAGTWTRYADLAEGYYFCYNQGFITYLTHRDHANRANWVEYGGPMGSERRLVGDDPRGTRGGVGAEYLPCSWTKRKPLLRPEHVGAMVWHLRPEHGYLHVGRPSEPGELAVNPRNQNEPALLVRPGNDAPIPLPILVKELDVSTKITFAEHAQKYVINPGNRWTADVSTRIDSWPKGHPIRLYILSLDGSVETIEIPYGNRPSLVFLTKQGLFFVSSNTRGAQSRTAGGWLLRNGKQTKLFEHMPEAAGVSPDGCRIAYAYNDYNRDTREYVQIVDLCQ